MNLTLQRYHICIAVVKYLGDFFTGSENNFFHSEAQILVVDDSDVVGVVFKVTGIYHGLFADGRLYPFLVRLRTPCCMLWTT